MAPQKGSADTERRKTQSDCVTEAIWAGAKSSAWAGATSASVVLLANQYWPAFRSSLGVSGKTALIVSFISITSRASFLVLRRWPARRDATSRDAALSLNSLVMLGQMHSARLTICWIYSTRPCRSFMLWRSWTPLKALTPCIFPSGGSRILTFHPGPQYVWAWSQQFPEAAESHVASPHPVAAGHPHLWHVLPAS